ncbi:MAG: hotdog fold thioesterase [Planctomycetes bacterium]|nr:hotdog fold thioesterase [Planctomycetota bacterium]
MSADPRPEGDLVDLDLVRQIFDEAIPFNRFLGLRLLTVERGRVLASLPFRPELIGDPLRPALHGGVISMVADTVGGSAVWSLTGPGDRVATIDLRVDYLRPGRALELQASAEVLRVGNRVGVSSIRAFHPDDPERPVAVAMGVYTVKRAGEV